MPETSSASDKCESFPHSSVKSNTCVYVYTCVSVFDQNRLEDLLYNRGTK